MNTSQSGTDPADKGNTVHEIKAIVWKLRFHESPFLRFFGFDIGESLRTFLASLPEDEKPNLFSSENGKAFIHAFYLYTIDTAVEYASIYDVTNDTGKKPRTLILRAFNTIQSIRHLSRLPLCNVEKQTLSDFSTRVSTKLDQAIPADIQKKVTTLARIDDIEKYLDSHPITAEDPFSFFDEQSRLILLPAYQVYLQLRNRFFLNTIEPYMIDQHTARVISGFLKEKSCADIYDLNYLQVETLLKQLLGARTDYLFLEFSDEFNGVMFSKSSGSDAADQYLRAGGAPDPETALSPFERLCLQHKTELATLISNMEWVHKALNRFLLPKITDYVSKEADIHRAFLGGDETRIAVFTRYLTELLEKTRSINPYPPQSDVVGLVTYKKGRQVIESKERVREQMAILRDRLPFDKQVTYSKKQAPVPRNTEFIIKFGVTYFDMDKLTAFRSKTKPIGYVQLFLHSDRIEQYNDPLAHEMYLGKRVFLSINQDSMNNWRDVVFLSLIAFGQKYDLAIPQELEDMLVEEIGAGSLKAFEKQ